MRHRLTRRATRPHAGCRPIAAFEITGDPVSMKIHPWLVCLALALVAGPAFAGTSACGMPDISSASELERFMSLRAVEVVRRAARSDDGLAALVAPSASFSLGAGDVGGPLGTGVDGARALALVMKADTYRFLGWDYMDDLVDPCAKRKVQVEFIDSQRRSVSRVDFTFEAGRVASAEGWERSFDTGRL